MSHNPVENLVSHLQTASKQKPKTATELCMAMLLESNTSLKKIIYMAINDGYPVVRAYDTHAYYIGDDNDRRKLADKKIAHACKELEGAQRLLKIPVKKQISVSDIYTLIGDECSMRKAKDLTGQRFGRLTAIERVGADKSGSALWRCLCDCGKEIVARQDRLHRGHTKSCGCLFTEGCAENTRLRALISKIGKNNTSGTKGVCFEARKQKWRATIWLQGKQYFLGYFSEKEDAIKARKRAEETLFEPMLNKYGRTLRKQEEQ